MMKTLIRFIITAILISFILWNRLIRERIPKDLDDFISNNNILLLIIGILLITHSISFLISLRYIFFFAKKENIISKLFNMQIMQKPKKWLNYIINAPKELYDEFSDKYDLFTKKIELSASYLVAYYNSERNQQIFLTIFIYLPRLILASVFILDIFYFQRFHYFYITLILLLIPLMTKIYLYMVFYQSKLMYEYSEFFLDITPMQGCVEIKIKSIPVRGYNLEWMVSKYQYFKNHWYIGTKLNNVITCVYMKDAKMSPYVNIYTSLCYIIGWSYIFFKAIC